METKKSQDVQISRPHTPSIPRINAEKEEIEDFDVYRKKLKFIEEYRNSLSNLTCSSRRTISELTAMAGEKILAAKGIAATICSNVLEVPCQQKISCLYLIDSIAKNIGSDYLIYFSAWVPEIFIEVYGEQNTLRPRLDELFRAWKTLFSPDFIARIEKELGFSSSTTNTSSKLERGGEEQLQQTKDEAETSVASVSNPADVVTANERQSLCPICGEPFEKLYCRETDKVIYKGAVYLNTLDKGGVTELAEENSIVHASCLSGGAVQNFLGMMKQYSD